MTGEVWKRGGATRKKSYRDNKGVIPEESPNSQRVLKGLREEVEKKEKELEKKGYIVRDVPSLKPDEATRTGPE